MFFIGIFGIQDKVKLLNEYPNVTCRCGALSTAESIEKYRYFHIFFIPIYKWNRARFVRMRCCGSLFRMPDDHAEDLKRDLDLDMGRLEEFDSHEAGRCVHCGAELHPSFSFCPYCGGKNMWKTKGTVPVVRHSK